MLHQGATSGLDVVRAPCVELRLLGRFTLVVDETVLPVTRTEQRLLARLALSEGGQDRAALAAALWPSHQDARAQANLRGAVCRLPTRLRRRLRVGAGTLAFDGAWEVDVHAAEQLAAGLAVDQPRTPAGLPAASAFRHDLLPSWDESWLVMPRERHRQLRLHALEDLARHHLDAGRPFHALDCALLAIQAEPLRESAQRLLIRSHLAAGNRAAARASYDTFRQLLADELAVLPSPDLTALVRGLVAPGAAGAADRAARHRG